MWAARQHSDFFGMLASIGVPIAIDLIKVFGKGLQVGEVQARTRASITPTTTTIKVG